MFWRERRARAGVVLVVASVLAGAGCGPTQGSPADEQQADIDTILRAEIEARGIEPMSAPAPAPAPKVALGRALYFDKILSGNKDTSCASCHHPSKMTADEMALSAGTGAVVDGDVRRLGEGREWAPRHATDIYNRGHRDWETMYWDRRIRETRGGHLLSPAGSRLPEGLDNVLAAQAMFPPTSRDEMRGERGDRDIFGEPNELASTVDGLLTRIWAQLMERLMASPEYRQMFAEAYPEVEPEALGFEHAANALAAFQAEAFTFTESPWDRYVAGDRDALTEEQKEGARLFYGEASCASCHAGTLMTDQEAHNLGVPQFGPGKEPDRPMDLGWGRVINDPSMAYAFRTPPLRNVELTAPYMHNGAYQTLEGAIRHHLDAEQMLRRYTGESLVPELRERLHDKDEQLESILETLSPSVARASRLSDDEVRALVAFMGALTDPAAADLDHHIPSAVPSGLPVD